MPDSLPLVSIITATYNAAATLPALLESLAEQSFRDCELVIQDGASSDGTVAAAESARHRLSALSMISEPDSGIYDAWNKAVARASGVWILFLGADDRLHGAGALAKAAEQLVAVPETVDFFAASLLLTLPTGSAIETWRPEKNIFEKLPSGMPLPHPALFYKARLFSRNRFTASLKIAGDYDFLCRTVRKDNYLSSPLVVSEMSVGGVSASLPSMLDSEMECFAISRKYFPRSFPARLYARMARSAGYRVVAALMGERAGRVFADFARKAQGKVPLWAKKSAGPILPALPEEPLVSLIVATLGRREELQRLFESLAKQTYKNFEVLLADQNPQGVLVDSIDAARRHFPITHKPLRETGVSRARNALLPLAGGNIIAFPDDDCWYEPHALEYIVKELAAQPHLGGVLINWNDGNHAPPQRECVQAVRKMNAFRCTETFTQFYRREALAGIIFDEELGPGTGLPYGSGEDTDFVLQVLESGAVMQRISDSLIHHPKPDLGDPALPSKALAYAMGRMRLLCKHRFPLWFKLANVVYPLFCVLREGKKAWPYRKAMFWGRARGFFGKR